MQAPYHHRPVSRPVVVSFIAMTGLLATPFFFAVAKLAMSVSRKSLLFVHFV